MLADDETRGAMSEIPEPTADDCTQMASLPLPDGRTGTALWWPQMGRIRRSLLGRCRPGRLRRPVGVAQRRVPVQRPG
jgi:hypothetical protein